MTRPTGGTGGVIPVGGGPARETPAPASENVIPFPVPPQQKPSESKKAEIDIGGILCGVFFVIGGIGIIYAACRGKR